MKFEAEISADLHTWIVLHMPRTLYWSQAGRRAPNDKYSALGQVDAGGRSRLKSKILALPGGAPEAAIGVLENKDYPSSLYPQIDPMPAACPCGPVLTQITIRELYAKCEMGSSGVRQNIDSSAVLHSGGPWVHSLDESMLPKGCCFQWILHIRRFSQAFLG